jgi:hypothetical protein
MADSGAAADAPISKLERVDGIKGRLATLRTHEDELDAELRELVPEVQPRGAINFEEYAVQIRPCMLT